MNEDFSFFWPNRGIPYFLDPDGRVLEPQVIYDIPYLLSGTISRDVEYRGIDLLMNYPDHDCIVYPRWQRDCGIPKDHPAVKKQRGRSPRAALPGSGASSSSGGMPPPAAEPNAGDQGG